VLVPVIGGPAGDRLLVEVSGDLGETWTQWS